LGREIHDALTVFPREGVHQREQRSSTAASNRGERGLEVD
jgi:hypothetical protein